MSGLGTFSYIERDYIDILAAVVARIPKITPEWTDWNQSDIGMTLLQLFTGMAEMLAYTQDQFANQLTISTCTQRASMINLAKSLAYTMANVVASSTDLIFSRTTAYTSTTNITTLISPIVAQYTQTFMLADASQYDANDVIKLGNSEYVIIDYKIGSSIRIKGVTRYAYATGTSVGKITRNRNIIIPDKLKCSTSGAGAILFETVAPDANYVLYGGSIHPNQTTVLAYNVDLKSITVANPFDYTVGDVLYLKSSLFTNAETLMIAIITGRVIIFSESLPLWIQVGDIIARQIPCTQGQTKTETLTASTGLPSQTRELTYTPVISDSGILNINEGSGATPWSLVDSFYGSDSNDKHYTLEIQANDKALITFGDGVNGKIPVLGSTIVASYVQGGGTSGNVGKNTISKINDSITDVGGATVSLIVSNPEASSGGTNKESLDVARVRAPALYSSVYRAVSILDFETLAKGFRDSTYGAISNAKVIESELDNAVSIYVWTADSSGSATSASSGLKSALLSYLTERAGVSYLISIVDGYLTAVNISATVYVTSGYSQTAVRSSTICAINTMFQIESLVPGEDFYLGNLYEKLEVVEGVDRVDITMPLRPGVAISALHVPIKGSLNLIMVGGN